MTQVSPAQLIPVFPVRCSRSEPGMFVPAELRRQEETGQLLQPVLFVLLVLVSVLLYFAVSLMDPGFILTEDSDLQVSQGRYQEVGCRGARPETDPVKGVKIQPRSSICIRTH